MSTVLPPTVPVSRPSALVPPSFAGSPPVRRRWLGRAGWLALAALAAAQGVAIAISPPDGLMGELQRIMYVHVPVAWGAFLAFFVVFVGSAAYLWRGAPGADRMAHAAAEVGTVLTALTLCLGSLWGRPTWGVWWTWDPRLTTTAVLLLLFAGYLALRAYGEDRERTARWCAAVGLLGFANVPIVYMSVRWWRTLHQPQSSPATLDPSYAAGLRLNAIAFMLVLAFLIARRAQALRLEQTLEARRDLRARAGGFPDE